MPHMPPKRQEPRRRIQVDMLSHKLKIAGLEGWRKTESTTFAPGGCVCDATRGESSFKGILGFQGDVWRRIGRCSEAMVRRNDPNCSCHERRLRYLNSSASLRHGGYCPSIIWPANPHFRRWCGGEGEHNPIDLAGFPRIANRLIGSRLCMKYRRPFGNGFIIIAARRSRLISRCSDVQMSSGIADISNIAGLDMVLRNIYEFGCFRIASDRA